MILGSYVLSLNTFSTVEKKEYVFMAIAVINVILNFYVVSREVFFLYSLAPCMDTKLFLPFRKKIINICNEKKEEG